MNTFTTSIAESFEYTTNTISYLWEYDQGYWRDMWISPPTLQNYVTKTNNLTVVWTPRPPLQGSVETTAVPWMPLPPSLSFMKNITNFAEHRISISNAISYVEYHNHCMELSEYHNHSDRSKRIPPPPSQRNVDTMIIIVVMQMLPSPLHFCDSHDPQQGRVT